MGSMVIMPYLGHLILASSPHSLRLNEKGQMVVIFLTCADAKLLFERLPVACEVDSSFLQHAKINNV